MINTSMEVISVLKKFYVPFYPTMFKVQHVAPVITDLLLEGDGQAHPR